ncbi:TIGR02302 family protein [Rhodobacteraceae bacterium RKSG542]|uniref:TIGR02302 family protein n=1 Tax=Pseudovibrio flavus TaxID=2529854 RepID=UPI0012BCFCEE|nr:TIGR02302 family protein [Pseudovibrio flavus]MTI18432.1 TIGR02302 family protein [Pseudovibrio flavus]
MNDDANVTEQSVTPRSAGRQGADSARSSLFSQSIEGTIERKVLLSRLALIWERGWPLVLWPISFLAVYAGLSFLGFWQVIPLYLVGTLVVVLAAGFSVSVWRCRTFRFPTRADCLRRVELQSGVDHRPLVGMEDRLAAGADDPAASALWTVHQKRLREALGALKVGYPNAKTYQRDPYGIRAVVGLFVVASLGLSGGANWQSLLDPFNRQASGTSVATRIDAWITPPLYTGEAPIFLSGSSMELREEGAPITVVEGSEVLVRVQGDREASMYFKGEDTTGAGEPLPEIKAPDGRRQQAQEWQFDLASSGELVLAEGRNIIRSWQFSVTEDKPPQIRLLEPPSEQLSGSLKLLYEAGDDYGVASARAEIAASGSMQRAHKPLSPLVEAPKFMLSLPAGKGLSGTAETFKDLTAHPWAGSEVFLVLIAVDEAGQETRSDPVRLTLPQRRFTEPLALSLVEQRRELAMDTNRQVDVIDAMDSLLIAPEVFINDAGIYLPLNHVYSRLTDARSDEALTPIVGALWDIALTVEDGDLSHAERALREAQEALRRALEEGASEAEIAKLMDNLRKALQEYLQALRQQMEQSPQTAQQMPPDPNAQSISPQDLEEMMRRMEELAKTGSLEAARELLAQMQQMLENLQTARPQRPNPQQQKMLEALQELGDLIEGQQSLMDETHQQRQQNGQMQQDQGGQSMEDALRSLQKQQGALSDRLQKLLDDLANNGAEPNQQLDQAGEAMGDAQDALKEGQTGQAVGEQGEAVEALRQGARQLADQLTGQSGGQSAGTRSPYSQDPLGRMRRTEGPEFGNQVEIPDVIDVQRARRILEELRRRFSDPDRPPHELDYLERLLKQY